MGESDHRRKKMKKAGLLILIVLLILGGFFYYQYSEKQRHKFKLVFLNVGQGDAALIQFESTEKILVDCGPDKTILSALGRNLSFFDRTIDTLIVSHPDLDHYGGCVDVLKNYLVKNILVNGNEKNDSFFGEWKMAIANKKVEIENGHRYFSIASSTLEFFSPDESLGVPSKSGENNFSIVFKLSHLGNEYLFTGDMEEPLEKILAEKYCSSPSCPLQADVLKVGHHGSDTASSELFLNYVKPKTAVISVGKNKFGHPTLRAIRHLERAGARILRTDLLGDVRFDH